MPWYDILIFFASLDLRHYNEKERFVNIDRKCIPTNACWKERNTKTGRFSSKKEKRKRRKFVIFIIVVIVSLHHCYQQNLLHHLHPKCLSEDLSKKNDLQPHLQTQWPTFQPSRVPFHHQNHQALGHLVAYHRDQIYQEELLFRLNLN